MAKNSYLCNIYNRNPSAFMSQDKILTFKNLTPRHVDQILNLQDECVLTLPDTRLYYPLTKEELLESLSEDVVIGAFDSARLVAVAVIIVNRDSPRNLAGESGSRPENTFTFDAVMVSPRWRGRGLQRTLLNQCVEMARKRGVHQVLATVSPDNVHSLNNFIRHGFEVLSTSEKYDGLVRHVVGYTIPG